MIDSLELNIKIDRALSNASVNMVGPGINFIAGSQSPDAYKLIGRYHIKNGDIMANMTLYRGSKLVQKIQLTRSLLSVGSFVKEVVSKALKCIQENNLNRK